MEKILIVLFAVCAILGCGKKDDVDLPADNFVSFYFDGAPWVSSSYTAVDSLGYIKIRARGKGDNSIFNMTLLKSADNNFQLVDAFYSNNIEPYKYNTTDPNEFLTPTFYDPATFKMQGRFSFLMRYTFNREVVKQVTFGQYSITYKPLGQ
ncbi:MAG TPA: hypothetical protein VF691_17405 [Cytophagaceae bacterium]|jgi:hypothetical protein